MKTVLFLLVGLWSLSLRMSAQQMTPGGVNGIDIWYAAENRPDGSIFWGNKLNPAQQGMTRKNNGDAASTLNFNPILPLNGSADAFTLFLGNADYTRHTIFTVFHQAAFMGNTCVWSWSDSTALKLAMTTNSVYDYEDSAEISFNRRQGGLPVIHTYFQCKNSASGFKVKNRLTFGEAADPRDGPAAPFHGGLAELIVFDRFLSGFEKQKIETYLAIKYGIPLAQDAQPAAYLDANGDTIWQAKKNHPFRHHIAGIGRDDISGLLQPISNCSHEPGLLTIGLHGRPENMGNNSFLIWADNAEDLEVAPAKTGRPAYLSRLWLATARGNIPVLPTTVQFNARMSEQQPGPGETWWLCIDRSGEGKFDRETAAYYKADSISPAGIVFINGVLWDSDHSGTDMFTLGIGPLMMSKIWMSAPRCTPPASGTVFIGAEGGRPPYRFQLSGAGSGVKQAWEAQDNAIGEIAGLGPGDYTLTIQDADNTVRTEVFYLESADAPAPNLSARYDLKPGNPLIINALKHLSAGNYSCRWSGPEGFQSADPEITISMPGQYHLHLEREGCEARQDIVVEQYAESNFRQLAVYPNPVRTANPVDITIQMQREAPVQMEVAGLNSVVLLRKGFYGNNFYRHSEILDLPAGAYILTFRSEQSVQSLKLVVE